MITVRAALDQGTRLLDEARVPVPRLTAEVLLCHALRREKPYLYSHSTDELSELAWIHYGRYLNDRLNGKPTQYITKRQEFYGREFLVTPAVLIPRPETEHVVETALKHLGSGSRVVDIGCGSGAIAVTLSLEAGIPALASDISVEALAIAGQNSANLGARVSFFAGDVLEALRDRSLDLVASNPPYVGLSEKASLQREVRDFEPEVALYGGSTGHEIYERLIRDAERVLVPGGRVVFELGYRSLAAVEAMFGERWSGVEAIPDLAGYPRVVTARFVK